MLIVDCAEDFKIWKKELQNNDSFWVPVWSDPFVHAIHNRLSFIYVYMIDSKQEWILSLAHTECMHLQRDLLTGATSSRSIFVLGKKQLKFVLDIPCKDADLVEYWQTHRHLQLQDVDTEAHHFYFKRYHDIVNLNDIIPMVKHFERCQNIKDVFMKSYETWQHDSAFDVYNDMFIDNLYSIEFNGLRVNEKQYYESFNSNGLVAGKTYSEYNIYTSTGRPSNRYGGVNYAALNKEDGTRKSFISRFERGMLLEFDYDSYHLRLIAMAIGYDFPEGNVHEFFAKQYFDKTEINQSEYEQSKQLTFRQIYGGVSKEYAHIKFFQKVQAFVNQLWINFQDDGYIETGIYNRKLYKKSLGDMNANKLFNYFLQSMETEYSLSVINEVNEFIQNYNSKVILYTYDSLLFDYDMTDGRDFILKLKDLMSSNGKMPVKLKAGSNLHELQDMTNKIK